MVALAFLLLVAHGLAAQDFSGSKSCAVCHSAIAANQAATNHAKALSQDRDGRWAFGAGAQAITWISQASEDTYLEHGLSWYRKTRGLALTPGHSTNKGVLYRTFAPDAAVLRCFGCHSTGSLRVNDARSILPLEPGVRCESCHGAGAGHARSPQRGNIRNPAELKAPAVNDLCGQCHRMPPADGVATNFDNPWNVRHQPVYFSQSQCFLKSSGTFSCISCHSPHQDSSPATLQSIAKAKCAECHAKPNHRNEVSGASCVSCHMPAVAPSPMLTFANHWIGIYRLTGPRANPLRPLQQ